MSTNALFTPAIVTLMTGLVLSAALAARTPGHGSAPPQSVPAGEAPPPVDDPCAVKELRQSEAGGVVIHSPDGKRFVVNKKDERGVAQIYVGEHGGPALTCISCTQRAGGPKPERFKMQPSWHPSGRWLLVPAERDTYSRPPILGWSRKFVEGQLRNGLWTNMYAVSPDGTEWHRLTDFKSGVRGVADGYTGPVFTHDGTRAVWSEFADGNVLVYWPFGRWELILADFDERDGVPRWINRRTITPNGMHWNEVGNFHPDNESLLLSGSIGKDARGMDQYVLNIRTGELTNLTKSPTVWDEHGRFSPNGEKILFMSSYPYRRDRSSARILSLKTEFMLMNSDGSDLIQLTHFRTPGYPESTKNGIAANPEWHPDGRSAGLRVLFFPDYVDWIIEFSGACGGSAVPR